MASIAKLGDSRARVWVRPPLDRRPVGSRLMWEVVTLSPMVSPLAAGSLANPPVASSEILLSPSVMVPAQFPPDGDRLFARIELLNVTVPTNPPDGGRLKITPPSLAPDLLPQK